MSSLVVTVPVMLVPVKTGETTAAAAAIAATAKTVHATKQLRVIFALVERRS